MKKITLILFLLITLGGLKNAKAQLALEHIYGGAAMQLYMVNLEIEGMKYAWRDYPLYLKLYNLDHSLYKTIPLPPSVFSSGNVPYVFYLSEHLFNTDDSIELMYGNASNTEWNFNIISESGNVIFHSDSLGPLFTFLTAPQAQVPVYNTPDGAKMILSDRDGNARVYGLNGHLSNSIQQFGVGNTDGLNIFPNPSYENTTIDFTLPKGVNTADIVLYNLNGTEIKRYKVDNTFNNLILNNSDLKSGTYLYELVTENQTIGVKKMIVIN